MVSMLRTDTVTSLPANNLLMSRSTAFGDAGRRAATLSPDGRRLAWLESRAGVFNLMVAPSDLSSKPFQVTQEAQRSVRPPLIWARTNCHIIVFLDEDGDENYRAFSINVDNGRVIPLTPGGGAQALFRRHSVSNRSEVLFSINDRNRRFFDLVRVNVITGDNVPLFMNDAFSKLHVTGHFEVYFAERTLNDGSCEIVHRQADGAWKPLVQIPLEDVLTTRVVAIAATGRSLFLIDSRNRDRGALVEIEAATGRCKILVEDPDADVDDVVIDPSTDRPIGAVAVATRQRWHGLNAAICRDLAKIASMVGDADFWIVDTDETVSRFLVRAEPSDVPPSYHLYDRHSPQPAPVIIRTLDEPGGPFRPMKAITIYARDGLALQSYITVPAKGSGYWPMVVVVHGGPYARDKWEFSPVHQWLAGCGYVVLSINFRGSTGFGKRFVNAADGEWGGRMQDDLADGADWAIREGLADPNRIALHGASYGGYASLMAAALIPDRFTCFVDVCGPSNLVSFMESIPTYWGSWFAVIVRRLADHRTPEGRAWLTRRSPIAHVEAIRRPVLIAQGLQDVRVKPDESRRMARALRERGAPVTLVTFPDEGHFFAQGRNRIALAAVIETFLARNVGGTLETPWQDIAASSMAVEIGGELLGLGGELQPGAADPTIVA